MTKTQPKTLDRKLLRVAKQIDAKRQLLWRLRAFDWASCTLEQLQQIAAWLDEAGK